MTPIVNAPGNQQVPGRPNPPLKDGSRLDGLMVFDGLCNFCSVHVRILLRIDRNAAIRFTSIQSPYGRHISVRYGIDPDDPATFVFFDAGHPRIASDAVVAVLSRLPRPWRWLQVLRAIPRPWRDRGYQWIAHNRYRLFGKSDTCEVPSAEVRARFINTIPEDEH